MHLYIPIINAVILIYYQIQQSGCRYNEQLHSTKCSSFRYLIIRTSLSWLNSILVVEQRTDNVTIL